MTIIEQYERLTSMHLRDKNARLKVMTMTNDMKTRELLRKGSELMERNTALNGNVGHTADMLRDLLKKIKKDNA